LGLFGIFSLLFLISFSKSIFISPGEVPISQDWSIDSDSDLISLDVLSKQREKRRDGSSRICYMCSKFKPDRSHHCRICGECVLKMDHHCPWIANCVGYYNYKYFFLTINYGMIALGVYCGTLWESVVIIINNDENLYTASLGILMLYSLSCLLEIGLIGFTIFHYYLIMNNYGTVEFCEKKSNH